MIAGIRGIVEEIGIGKVLLEARGVIYDITLSLHTSSEIKKGEEIRLWITEIIREDAYLLFGFLHKEEQRIFERLIKINGVGPKVAMAILSTYTPQNFAQIVEQKNITALQKVSGVGAKGASKIMVDLAGFFDFSLEVSGDQKAKEEAILALEGLGFKKSEIEKVMKKVSAKDTAGMIKEALKYFQMI
ncbi:Holliday junction branch migration protein RuvA [Helicobacter brantae]|uniref:Holliday junction branch migration complex subunit RuvA n=1 Tax=Helicobacter brantae TaxID=375927 RepID=A0A3D8J1W6_9HELI|nr:Holliday junction branch migration protein RuvA [Helicobacter brantae]RDU71196.1 Holliday junction branch migration protein RuvA [Helicobacter brantae]